MGREIVSARDVAGSVVMGPAPAATSSPIKVPDTYVDRLIKYIPPDVIAVFATVEGMIASTDAANDHALLAWLAFAVILVACPLYLWRVGGVTKPLQLILSTVAFAVWAFAYRGPPFSLLDISPIYGAVLLALTTFLIPIVVA